nr:MAG TPA: Tail-associated lysozyme [Caudoviricetes sp.]
MITKGEVQINYNSLENNKVSVRIPLFENAGNNVKYIVDCNICYPIGVITYFKKGDIVWIAFENNELNKPVVIGSLLQGNSDLSKDNSSVIINSLTTNNSAVLPSNTSVGGFNLMDIIQQCLNNAEELKNINEQLNNK